MDVHGTTGCPWDSHGVRFLSDVDFHGTMNVLEDFSAMDIHGSMGVCFHGTVGCPWDLNVFDFPSWRPMGPCSWYGSSGVADVLGTMFFFAFFLHRCTAPLFFFFQI